MRIYKCRLPDQDGEDWTTVEAFNAEDAAIRYAEDCDSSSGGELFEDGGEHIILVIDPKGVERKFKCNMELEPNYWANEIDPKPEPQEGDDIPC